MRTNTGAITWAVLGLTCLGTVLVVWLGHPTAQPSSLLGSAAATAVSR